MYLQWVPVDCIHCGSEIIRIIVFAMFAMFTNGPPDDRRPDRIVLRVADQSIV